MVAQYGAYCVVCGSRGCEHIASNEYQPSVIWRDPEEDRYGQLSMAADLSASKQYVLHAMRAVRDDPVQFGRLHEIEQMILTDLINDPRPFKCNNCLRWALALIEKANKQDEVNNG